MRKDSIIIFTLSVIISAGIVGGLSYLHYNSNLGQDVSAETPHSDPLTTTITQRRQSTGKVNLPSATAPTRFPKSP